MFPLPAAFTGNSFVAGRLWADFPTLPPSREHLNTQGAKPVLNSGLVLKQAACVCPGLIASHSEKRRGIKNYNSLNPKPPRTSNSEALKFEIL